MSITMIGLDTAKSVFQVHAVDAAGKTAMRRKLRRSELIPFFEGRQRCTVVMEACGAAHHWARVLGGLGHEVKLIAPEAVRPFVKKGKKNDAADAAATLRGRVPARCEVRAGEEPGAAGRPGPAFGAGPAGQAADDAGQRHAWPGDRVRPGRAARAWAGSRSSWRWWRRTGPSRSRRGRRSPGCSSSAARPPSGSRRCEAEIVAHARRDDTARRLATIPGIGPITASLIAATVGGNIGAFRSARHFAAWLGLVPRQHSTGGKTRLGRITKAGNREIRRLLVLGATSMVYRAGQWNSAAGAWTRGLLARRPVRLATVALANKMARIAWALMTRNEIYQAKGRARPLRPPWRDVPARLVGGGREPDGSGGKRRTA